MYKNKVGIWIFGRVYIMKVIYNRYIRKIRLVCVVWSWIIIGFRFGFNLYKKRKIIFLVLRKLKLLFMNDIEVS